MMVQSYRLSGPWALVVGLLLATTLLDVVAEDSSQVEEIRSGNNQPPYSMKCGTLLFVPLQESCGFENGDLVNLIVSLLSGNGEVHPDYPPEACSAACSEAVLGVIRSSEACKDVKQWLPIGTTDLRQLMGKRYSRACEAQMVELQEDETDAEAGMDADLQCMEALDTCELILPGSAGLHMSELQGPMDGRMLMDNWSCPASCSLSNVTLLLTERCTRILIVRSIVRNTWATGVSAQSDSNPPMEADAQQKAISSVLSLLGGEKGLDHVCMRNINPTGEEITLVRISIAGLEAAQKTDEAEMSGVVAYLLALSADALPEHAHANAVLGPNGAVSVEAQVVFPAADRLRAYEFSRMLQDDLQRAFGDGQGLLLSGSAKLKSIRSLAVEELSVLPTLEESSIDSVSGGRSSASPYLFVAVSMAAIATVFQNLLST